MAPPVLSRGLKAKLHREIEAYPRAHFSDLLELDSCAVFRGNLEFAGRNRFNYLKKLKDNNPQSYWQLLQGHNYSTLNLVMSSGE